MEKFNTENDLRLVVTGENEEYLVDEVCCTCINIIFKNDGQIMTSFLGAHNPEIVKTLEKAQKAYFKELKKTLKKKYNENHECCCAENCTCGDDCKCTPENHCGCGGHCHEQEEKHECNCGCGEHSKTKKEKAHNHNECCCGSSHKKDSCDCGCNDEEKTKNPKIIKTAKPANSSLAKSATKKPASKTTNTTTKRSTK